MSIRNAMSMPDDIPRHPLGVPDRVKREEAEAAKRKAEKEKRPPPVISDPRYVVTPQGGVTPRDYRLAEAAATRRTAASARRDPLQEITAPQLLEAFHRARERGATLEEAQACLQLVPNPDSADQRRLAYRMLQRLHPGKHEVDVSFGSAWARRVPLVSMISALDTAGVPSAGVPSAGVPGHGAASSAACLRAIELLDALQPTEDMLPEGIREAGPGQYEARCRACEQHRPLFVGLDEIPLVGYEHWCGGSPRCCP